MAKDTHLQPGEVNKIDLRGIFQKIREDVEQATTRETLNELYKQTGYMITLTHATPINEKVDKTVKLQRGIAEREFARTVRKINNRAKKLGIEADYSETWQELATHGYEAEGEHLLEPKENVGE